MPINTCTLNDRIAGVCAVGNRRWVCSRNCGIVVRVKFIIAIYMWRNVGVEKKSLKFVEIRRLLPPRHLASKMTHMIIIMDDLVEGGISSLLYDIAVAPTTTTTSPPRPRLDSPTQLCFLI